MSDNSLDNLVSRKSEGRWKIPPWSWAILVSALAWAVIVVAVPPAKQDFPLGDDWAFTHGAIWFAGGDGIHYSNWAGMPQLGQWLWSFPFLLVLGPPHFALRVSVIVLSWLGLVSFYDLLRQNKVTASLAGFAACVMAVNPLFFILQGTYMTDVPALSFGLMAMNCYSRALGQQNLRWLFGAIVLAVLGAITRQTMIAVPVAAGVMLLRHSELWRKPLWIISVILPVAACLGTSQWFAHRPDIKSMHLILNRGALLFRPFLAAHLCGLGVLPLSLLNLKRKSWKSFVISLAVMLLVVMAGFPYFFGSDLPYGGSFPYCFGVITTWGTYSDALVIGNHGVLLTPPIRMTLSILGCIGGAEILAAFIGRMRTRSLPGLLLLFTAFQFLFMLTFPVMMDRYLAVLFPGALYLMVTQNSESNSGWLPGAAAVGLCGYISVGLFHDWLSWNTARWELGRQAIAAQVIQPGEIEGGFEWDGWYASADPNWPKNVANANYTYYNEPGLSLPFSRMFFPQVTGRYALAFSRPESSEVIASLPYTLWLPAGHKEFLFVRFNKP